jgi:hypothetical protein
MSIEFLHGRPLSAEELEMLRRQIEEGFDNIAEVDERYAGSSLATGLIYCRSFRPRRTDVARRPEPNIAVPD